MISIGVQWETNEGPIFVCDLHNHGLRKWVRYVIDKIPTAPTGRFPSNSLLYRIDYDFEKQTKLKHQVIG